MKLSDVAKVFNKVVFTDLDGLNPFAGQILPFSDNVRSGMTTRRRILEVAPDVSIPSNSTIIEDVTGQVFIVAQANTDYYLASIIRKKHPVIPVDSTMAIRTVGGILSDSGGTTGVYASTSYIRRESFEDQSEFSSGIFVHFGASYSAPAGYIIHGDGRYFRVRLSSRTDDAGFGLADVVEIIDPLDTVTVQQKGSEIDPATDDYVSATPITDVDIFTEHIVLDYQHEALGYVKMEDGDKSVSFLKSQVTTINVGDKVGDYLVRATSDNTDFWTVHGRPV